MEFECICVPLFVITTAYTNKIILDVTISKSKICELFSHIIYYMVKLVFEKLIEGLGNRMEQKQKVSDKMDNISAHMVCV